ncbi:MAG TPA: class I SAM-dependent methyltransferase [Chryseobacterium sp.]
MNIEEAKYLLPRKFSDSKEIWADLGCGNGTFTYALAEVLPFESEIFAVDYGSQKLLEKHNEVSIYFQKENFENNHLDFPLLYGILMANSLHFVKDKKHLIKSLKSISNKIMKNGLL